MFQKRMPPIGARPGTLAIPEGSPPPQIHVFDYADERVREEDVSRVADLRRYFESPETCWIDVQGLGDEALLFEIAELCHIHPLALEDAVNAPQRAKSEIWNGSQLLIARSPLFERGELSVPQVALFLGPNYVLTFQERYFGFFDPVRERIRAGIGPIRSAGPAYLAYALVDTLVDRYYPIIEDITRELEELEVEIIQQTRPAVLARLHELRRQLVVLRRSGWPQRETISRLARDDTPYIPEAIRVYFRDTDDHMSQIVEAADSARETATGLTELYLSFESYRANEIMKVLTIMASIFIPLTFIAGIYGMNFEVMPELHSRRGYPMVLVGMVLVAGGMLAWFRRRGWIGSGGRSADRRRSDPPGSDRGD